MNISSMVPNRSLHLRLCMCALSLVGLLGASVASAASGQTAASQSWFGPRVGADSLANTPIGSAGHYVLAYRFRAAWSGSIAALRFYVITNPPGYTEYSGGSLGTLRVSLVRDQGSTRGPSQQVLAHVDYHPSTSQLFPRVRFPAPPQVTSGQYYDIVWTNIDPHPAENFVSVNSLLARSAGSGPPAPPITSTVLIGQAPNMARPGGFRARSSDPRDAYLPIIDITGGRGQHQGIGEMESWAENAKPIGGDYAVRELFSFVHPRPARVTSALIRVKRRGSGAAPLRVSLESPSGKTIASTEVEASHVPGTSDGWVEARFTKAPLVHPGQKLALVLRASDEDFEAYPLRDGTRYGFSSATLFAAGYAQFNTGDGWVGWDMWGESNRRDGDLQFALRLDP
jgi:hypothetical protein